MRVLMYGWEFPPHISGGLGTASYGLTNGMAEQSDMDITFVVPKLYAMRTLRTLRWLALTARRSFTMIIVPSTCVHGYTMRRR